jgi:hypothetical protein
MHKTETAALETGPIPVQTEAEALYVSILRSLRDMQKYFTPVDIPT